MLDEYFGKDRDVDFDDGGFLAIALDEEDLRYFAQTCVDLEAPGLEYVEYVPTERETYLNAFFLVNEYEYGMTLFVPMSIAPERLLKEAQVRRMSVIEAVTESAKQIATAGKRDCGTEHNGT
jgi:hypothetical protein